MDGRLVLSRGLSPACCKVLIALMMAGSALDMTALELWTGLERHTLARALRSLNALGTVVSQTGAHNRQTWLPVGDSFFSSVQLVKNLPTSVPPPPPIEESSVVKEEEEDIKRQLVENVPTGIDRELREAFREAGIGPRAGSRLARLGGVTARHVRWLHADTQARYRGENVTGLVVRRLLDGDPMPEGDGARQEVRLPPPPPSVYPDTVPMPAHLQRPNTRRLPKPTNGPAGGPDHA